MSKMIKRTTFLLPDECAESLASGNIEMPCIKAAITDLLSYSVLIGALAVKLPQIIIILKAKNVFGLSEEAFILEFLSASLTVTYNVMAKLPFNTWGETLFIAVQCAIQILLYWRYSSTSRTTLRSFSIGGFFLLLGSLLSGPLPPHGMIALGYAPILISLLSRIPQILQNHAQGHTGNLSLLSSLLTFGGNVARVFTTIQKISNRTILASHVAASCLNGTILLQILLYKPRKEGGKNKPRSEKRKLNKAE